MAGNNEHTPVQAQAEQPARAQAPKATPPRNNEPAKSASKVQRYADRMIARARELHDLDAFEPADREHLRKNFARVQHDRRFTKARIRQTILIFIVIIVIMSGMSLLLPYFGFNSMGLSGEIYSPQEVFDCYALWFTTTIMPLFDPTISNRAGAMLVEFNQTHSVVYSLVLQRGAVTLVVIACGILLAISGMLFQTSFKNPLATPSMLGVSDGITIGCIVLAFMGYSQASDNMPLYLVLVYGCGAAAVVAVLVLSRAIGGSKHFNIFDMLLLGTVVCQLLGGVVSYITNFGMDYTQWENFYNIQQAGDVLGDPRTWIVVGVVFVVTIIPVIAMRMKFNLVAFSDEEARMMGARPGALRAFALVLGSVMQLAAIASIGPVAMLSLAVPFLVRFLMPSDFRYQLLGNILLGIVVLLACIIVQHFATVGFITVPIGTIVSVFVIPFFVWAVALRSNSWGE